MEKKCLFYAYLLCFLMLLPLQAHAVSPGSSIHLYAIPGIFGQDYPEGWVVHSHVRYVQYDKAFDEKGNTVDAGMDVSATQIIEKIGHIYRFGENNRWQLSNILVVPAGVHMRANIKNGPSMSASGIGDSLLANFLGTHWNDHKYHLAASLALIMPTGNYDHDKALNVGGNRWVLFFPCLVGQFRFPLSKGMLMVEPFMNFEWRFENRDTGFKDHDCSEWGITLTYFPSNDCKLGLFIQPNYQFALNESEQDGKGMGDDDYYSLGGAIGATYSINAKENISLRWTYNIDGKGLDGGAPSAKMNAIHFVWSHVF